VEGRRIHFVGNVMIDTLLYNMDHATPLGGVFAAHQAERHLPLFSGGYGLVTLHRPSNVDDPETLKKLLTELRGISDKLPLIFPVHPRTRNCIQQAGLDRLLAGERFLTLPPVAYLEMLGLMKGARLVLTDSGGIQEETTALGVPCITMRENTERPITIEEGTNTIVGTDTRKIRDTVDDILTTGGKSGRIPELWDGKAAERIAAVINDWAAQAANNVAGAN
jgi:UDP-N-acetylglucosamine 2-epimerase (non-hydrolysing)